VAKIAWNTAWPFLLVLIAPREEGSSLSLTTPQHFTIGEQALSHAMLPLVGMLRQGATKRLVVRYLVHDDGHGKARRVEFLKGSDIWIEYEGDPSLPFVFGSWWSPPCEVPERDSVGSVVDRLRTAEAGF